jgi:phosphoglycolate phosphatase-like HAD superfamily hydrolase
VFRAWGRPMKTPPFTVCIFDVNGVLIDSNLANARAMGEAFTDDPQTRDRIAKRYLQMTGINRGEKIRSIQAQVIGRPFKDGEFEARWERFKILAHRAMTRAPLAPGAMEVLKELAKRRVRRAALSNTPLAELQEILAVHGLQELLDIVRGGGNWPKSESLLRLLREFHLPPGECLFLGDGRGDLDAARSAGVRFVAIDAETGEFSNERGFDGPYRNLGTWGVEFLGIRVQKESAFQLQER